MNSFEMGRVTQRIEKINYWLKDLLNEIGNHKMSISFVLIVFLLFWFVPQINDLIIILTQSENDFIDVSIFFSALTILAFLISNISSYFEPPEEPTTDELAEKPKSQSAFRIPRDRKETYIKEKKASGNYELDEAVSQDFNEDEDSKAFIKRMFPKVLGTLLIVLTAFGVNHNYYEIYGESIRPIVDYGLWIIVILLLIALHKKISNYIRRVLINKWTQYVPIALAIISIILIVLIRDNNLGGARKDIERLFLALLLLAAFFFLVSVSYNKYLLNLKDRFGAPAIIILTCLAFIGYAVLVYDPQKSQYIAPLSAIMICIIGIFVLVMGIKYIGFRFEIPLLSIVFFISLGLGIITANQENFIHYDVVPVKSENFANDRMELDAYITKWIDDRVDLIRASTTEKPFPVIFVSAEGGGSRAGLWSFLVHSYLYERNSDYFTKYLFSMSGASGGGVGNNMFYTQAYYLQDGRSSTNFKINRVTRSKNDLDYRASRFYIKDYLSTSVVSVMGRDLYKSITNFRTFNDRGKLLENEWEAGFNEVFEYPDIISPLAQSYLELMPIPDKYPFLRPLLITNTTHLKSGERAVISPVNIKRDSQNLGVFMDLLDRYPIKDSVMKRSTAMSLNARFPYVSSSARIKDLGQFGDAGYYDNIGGTVTRRLEKAFLKVVSKDSTLDGKYRIKHLLITNYVETEKDKLKESRDKNKEIDTIGYTNQMLVPPLMIWNATFAHPTEMVKTFGETYNIQSKRTAIQSTSEKHNAEFKPVIPLGRYLSKAAVRSLEKRLQAIEVTEALDDLIPGQ